MPSYLTDAHNATVFLHLIKVDWLNKFLETMWPYLDKVCIMFNVLKFCVAFCSRIFHFTF
jgi:hypothetical protein